MASLQANSKHIDISIIGLGDKTVRLFKSYKTVVGVQVDDTPPIFTSEKFSVTTSRHIRKFQFEHGGQFVTPAELQAALAGLGVRVNTSW